jgi:hypothetical protein
MVHVGINGNVHGPRLELPEIPPPHSQKKRIIAAASARENH